MYIFVIAALKAVDAIFLKPKRVREKEQKERNAAFQSGYREVGIPASKSSGAFAFVVLLLLAGGVAFWYFQISPMPESDSTPAQAIAANTSIATTPTHRLTTIAEAQREAVRRYPQLGTAGSPLNKAFVAEFNRRKQANPDFFRTPDWPMRLADELAPKPTLRYDIAKRWSIDGGEGKDIVIPLVDANEVGMAALVGKLREDTRSDRMAYVFIFDDAKAADMRKRVRNLTPSELEFYKRHYIGTYKRNANTALNEMEMHPTGMNGPSTMLKF
ncbi:MAG: hypothetical protein QOE70_2095 [Chthoniobacter sp.]|jgi:hypothetical protein|nr:hypothetical protein [Chthoniobacter sp.]